MEQSGCKSLNGLFWNVLDPDIAKSTFLVQKFGISEVLAKILVNRGIEGLEVAELFLYPKLKNLMPNPFLLNDMEKAVERIILAIQNKEKVLIYADYDVDGATSSALMIRFLAEFGLEVELYVPCRFEEGYGPNVKAFEKFLEAGINLIITVDCGSTSFDAINFLYNKPTQVIVIDHHLTTDTLPKAYAIVNPNRIDEDFEYNNIAAVGVVFFFIAAICSKMREKGFFKDSVEPNLIKYLDLVALGTVCDMMPLTGINRVFVQHGLKLINKRVNVGIKTLSDLSNLNKKADSQDLGYIFGPKINAGGRIGKGSLGSILLSTDSEEKAYEVAQKLQSYNAQRKSIEASALEKAISIIEQQQYYERQAILIHSENWHIGVIGILASKIKELYNKPVFVISTKDEIGKGSARSIRGINIGNCLAAAENRGLLVSGGGHSMAGGFTVKTKEIDNFYDFILNTIKNTVNINVLHNNEKALNIDACISVGGVQPSLLRELELGEPFGQGNPRPRFLIKEAILVKAWPVSDQHIFFKVRDNKNSVKCLLFNCMNKLYARRLLKKNNISLSIVGYLQFGFFNQNEIDIIVEDFSFL